MYDKSIVQEFGLYIPVIRTGDVTVRLKGCKSLRTAQLVLALHPYDLGIDSSEGRSEAVSRSTPSQRQWFEAKLAREDAFEDFLSKAEACR